MCLHSLAWLLFSVIQCSENSMPPGTTASSACFQNKCICSRFTFWNQTQPTYKRDWAVQINTAYISWICYLGNLWEWINACCKQLSLGVVCYIALLCQQLNNKITVSFFHPTNNTTHFKLCLFDSGIQKKKSVFNPIPLHADPIAKQRHCPSLDIFIFRCLS